MVGSKIDFAPLAIAVACAVAACSADSAEPGNRAGQRPPGAGGRAGSAAPGDDIPGNATGNGGARSPGAGGSRSDLPIDDECAAIEQTADNQLQPADIIIAVDNSGSMDEEIVFVREQLNAFSQQIVDSGIDVRIILISSPVQDPNAPPPPSNIFDDDDDDQDNGICIEPPLGSGNCPSDSNPPRYLHVAQEVKSHDALELFIETFPQWRSQLRPNSTKTFVVVTDDNAEDGPSSPAAFSQAVEGLDAALFAKWSFSGIYCFSECPEAAEIGTVYRDLVAQTMGVGGDLCLQDFKPVFDALAKSVIGASQLDCEWAIPPAPAGQMFDTGRVNVQFTSGTSAPQAVYHVESAGQCGAQGGWYYDNNASPERLFVCPSTCDLFQADGNAQLDVLFGCETKVGPD